MQLKEIIGSKSFFILSGLVQILFSLAFYIWIKFFPGADCRLASDCVGEALAYSFAVIPFFILGLVNLAVSFINGKIFSKAKAIVAIISWIYVLYIILPVIISLPIKLILDLIY